MDQSSQLMKWIVRVNYRGQMLSPLIINKQVHRLVITPKIFINKASVIKQMVITELRLYITLMLFSFSVMIPSIETC